MATETAPPPKPKILVISNYRSTTVARPEAEIFIGLAKMGFAVDIMTYGDAEYVEKFKQAGIGVIDFHPDKKFDKEAVAFIRRHLHEGGYQILHMFNSLAYFNGLKAAKGLSAKVVFYRGTQANMHWYDPTLYAKYFHPRVDKIVCNSLSVEEEILKQAIFTGSKKPVTINKGHRPEWYADVQSADLSTFGVKPGSMVFVNIANARRVKGVKYMMQAMQLLPPGLELYLLMVGHGLETPAMRRLADESHYKDRIIFTGFQPNALEISKAADVFVLTSTGAESLTKSVVEAMSLGTAPLITNIPGNKYMVEHGKSGLLVPPKDAKALALAMQALYDKPGWAGDLGAEAQKYIAKVLHTDRTIAEYAEFYTDLASGAGSYKTKADVL